MQKNFIKEISCIVVLTFSLLSCNTDLPIEQKNTATEVIEFNESNFAAVDKLKVKFARALGQAIKDNPDLRIFIKNESLKKFNLDYDVMYQLVKNKSVAGSNDNNSMSKSKVKTEGNQTIRNLLLNYFDSESELAEIESRLPLLTIFVPELPNNSFSAETWKAESEIPVIAIRMSDRNEVPAIDVVNDFEYVIESELIPAYPVIVIKNNERMQVVNNRTTNIMRSTDIISNGDGSSFRYLSDSFNPTYSRGLLPDKIFSPIDLPIDDDGGWSGSVGGGACQIPFIHEAGRQNTVPQFSKNAYNIFDGLVADYWMRDNVYYQQTPSNTTGAFTGGKYRESITWFRFAGIPRDVFNSLADQSNSTGDRDPSLANEFWSRDHLSAWTDGQFEISVSVEDNSKTRSQANTFITLPFAPNQLFSYTHRQITRHRWMGLSPRKYWMPDINGFKSVDMSQVLLDAQKFQFNTWSLFEYSNNWTITWKEVDNTVEFNSTASASRKFNTNIEGTLSGGSETKWGLKWGVSLQQDNFISRSSKWIQGSDNFGQYTVNFYDRFIFKSPCNEDFYPRIYTAGNVQFEFRPVQVEW